MTNEVAIGLLHFFINGRFIAKIRDNYGRIVKETNRMEV